MPVRTPTRPIADYHDLLFEHRPEYARRTPKQQTSIRHLVHLSYSSARKHLLSSDPLHDEADFFGWDMLRSMLGDDYQDVLSDTHTRVRGHVGYSPGIGKETHLHDDLRDAIRTTFLDPHPRPLRDAGSGRKIEEYPEGNAVCSYDVNRHPTKSSIYVPNTVQINTPNLVEAVGTLRRCLDRGRLDPVAEEITGSKTFSPGRIERRMDECLNLVRVARNTVLPEGTIPHRYQEKRNGRLVGMGTNLTLTSRGVRRVALGGLGLVDHDFSSCHPTILLHLAREVNPKFDGETIESYLDHKSKVRRQIADHIRTGIGNVKEGINALMYGASLSSHYESSLRPTFEGSSNLVHHFVNHDYVRLLHGELTEATGIVLNSLERRFGRVRNALGRELKVKGLSPGQILSHVVTGIEARCLEVAVGHVQMEQEESVHALCYDGWVSSGVDVEVVQRSISNEVGINLSISSSPFDYDLLPPPSPSSLPAHPLASDNTSQKVTISLPTVSTGRF